MLIPFRFISLFSLVLIFVTAQAQDKTTKDQGTKSNTKGTGKSGIVKVDKKDKKKETPELKWLTFTEAVELNKKEPKKILIDVYTEWCGWCKVMDKSTYTDTTIINYINKHFYPVKIDAEMKDTVRFRDIVFVNPNPAQSRSPHQLAQALLNGKMSYPTTVFLDEKFDMLGPLPGYYSAQNLEPVLVFYGEERYKTTKWEEFTKTFKGKVIPPPPAPQQQQPGAQPQK